MRWLFLLLLLACPSVKAQTSMEGGARVAALGGAGTALTGESWGHANPASWATLSERHVGFFATQAFGLEALQLGALHVVYPFAVGTMAVGARTFGYEAYRETRFEWGGARGFSLGTTRQFNLGIKFQYLQVSVPGYGSGNTITAGIGGLVQVLPGFDLGFHATNLHQPSIAADELARTLAIGIAYAPIPSLRVVTDVYKDVRFPLSLRAGIEAQPVKVLSIRAGTTTAPARISTGVGLHVGRIVADLAAERHVYLGWSPAIAFGMTW